MNDSIISGFLKTLRILKDYLSEIGELPGPLT